MSVCLSDWARKKKQGPLLGGEEAPVWAGEMAFVAGKLDARAILFVCAMCADSDHATFCAGASSIPTEEVQYRAESLL